MNWEEILDKRGKFGEQRKKKEEGGQRGERERECVIRWRVKLSFWKGMVLAPSKEQICKNGYDYIRVYLGFVCNPRCKWYLHTGTEGV